MASVLLIAGTTPLSTDDAKVETVLTDAGHTVTAVDQSVTHVAADMDVYGLVVVLESVSSATFVTNSGDAARDTTAPVACFEHGAWSHLGMASGRTRATASDLMWVVDATHPAAGRLNDAAHEFTTVTTQGSDYGTGLGVDATIVYSHHEAKTDANGFAYDAGDSMTTGTAPARRFGLGMHSDHLPGLESPGERMLEGVFNWLIDGTALPSEEPDPSVQTLIIVGEDVNPTTNDAGMRDRLIARGWSAELVNDDYWDDSWSDGREMVIEVASARGGPLTNSLTNISCPLLTSEGEWTDRTMGIVGSPPTNGHYDDTTLYLEDNTHPIAAGLPVGDLTVYDAAAGLNWCYIPRAAPYTVVAANTNGSNDVHMAALEAGETLEDGSTSAARVVYWFHYHTTFENLSTDGLSLFDAATDWLTAGDPPGEPSAGTSEWTGWTTAQTVADPGGTLVASSWTAYQETTVVQEPISEWWLAGASWKPANLVALS